MVKSFCGQCKYSYWDEYDQGLKCRAEKYVTREDDYQCQGMIISYGNCKNINKNNDCKEMKYPWNRWIKNIKLKKARKLEAQWEADKILMKNINTGVPDDDGDDEILEQEN